MNTQLRIGKTYRSQLLYVVLLPAFFAGFCFLYDPFGMKDYYQVGGMSFGFHFLMLACILLVGQVKKLQDEYFNTPDQYYLADKAEKAAKKAAK